MTEIKMVDLHAQYLRIKGEIDGAIQSVLDESAFVFGSEVDRFRENLRQCTGAGAVVTCGNGTDALQVALMALNLNPGDEVIVPVHTYVATAEVIALLGLKPLFVDADPRTFNIDVSKIEEVITPATRAIVPVHLYGQCADMQPILDIAARHNLFVIEDAAQALPAVYTMADGSEKIAGTMGEIGATSFFPTKNLGCYGDGGAIFTNDPVLAEKIEMIANHGQRIKYRHELIGVNSRLDTMQAAILNVKLRHLDDFTKRRNIAAAYYDEALAGVEGIQIPYRASNSTHVFHQYTLAVTRRDELKEYLADKGIPTMIYYPIPLHLQPAYARVEFGPGSFPVTEKLSRSIISLPMHTELTEDQLEYTCSAIKRFYL